MKNNKENRMHAAAEGPLFAFMTAMSLLLSALAAESVAHGRSYAPLVVGAAVVADAVTTGGWLYLFNKI